MMLQVNNMGLNASVWVPPPGQRYVKAKRIQGGPAWRQLCVLI